MIESWHIHFMQLGATSMLVRPGQSQQNISAITEWTSTLEDPEEVNTVANTLVDALSKKRSGSVADMAHVMMNAMIALYPERKVVVQVGPAKVVYYPDDKKEQKEGGQQVS